MRLFGSLSDYVSSIFKKNGQNITFRPNNGTTYTAARTMDLPPGDSSQVLLSETSVSTVSGKSMDGDVNTFVDIGITSLKTVLGDANKTIRRDSTGALVSGPSTISDAGAISGLTQLDVDNIEINGNTISSTNVNGDIDIDPNGTGVITAQAAVHLKAGSDLVLFDNDNSNKVSIGLPANVTADYSLTLPGDDGAASQFLQTDGSGILTWASPAGAQESALDVKNLELATSVSANALTIALKTGASADPSAGDAVNIAFRSSTETSGVFTVRSATAATSLVISSGSTLGHANGIAYPIYVYALDNAGTIELAASTRLYNTERVQSTTAEGGAGAADSGNTIYSTTARSGVPFRLIGKLISTQTTAGTWASVPTVAAVAGIRDVSATGVQGIQTSTAPSVGYIGEVISLNKDTNTAITNTAYTDSTSGVLTPGIWLASGSLRVIRNGVTYTGFDARIGFSGTSGNSSTGLVENYNLSFLIHTTASAVQYEELAVALPASLIRFDGTTITLSNGSTVTTTGGTVYLKVLISGDATNTALTRARITFVRIA